MLNAIRTRRSIRRYSDRPVEPAAVEILCEAVLRAPSSRNLRPCRFVFVTDPELLRELSHAKPRFGEFIADAPLAVVICGDATASDCWIEDCSIAATHLMLAATELGLGTCWVQIRARDHADGRPAEQHVRETLTLPDGLSVLCIVPVGHPAEDRAPRDRDTLRWDAIEDR